MDSRIGQVVKVLVCTNKHTKRRVIISTYVKSSQSDDKYINHQIREFEIIGEKDGCYVVLLPNDLKHHGFKINEEDLESANINNKFLNMYGFYIKESAILKD